MTGRRAFFKIGLAGALCALLAVSAGDSGTRAGTSPQAVQRWEASAKRRWSGAHGGRAAQPYGSTVDARPLPVATAEARTRGATE